MSEFLNVSGFVVIAKCESRLTILFSFYTCIPQFDIIFMSCSTATKIYFYNISVKYDNRLQLVLVIIASLLLKYNVISCDVCYFWRPRLSMRVPMVTAPK